MLAGALLLALQAALPVPDSTATVVPGAAFRAGGLHRFLLGSTWRQLWTTPIQVPVLDLDRTGGGLVASERGGSKQTRSLRFRSADGRVLVFRALEKDPTQTWPEPLRESPARRLAEDQISALLPAGALVVSALEDAAGLLHARPALFLLPDDPRLGEWRAEFAGNLGLVEERLRGRGDLVEAALGAREVAGTDALFERLDGSGAHRVDGAAYLAARLFDLFVGDWDRHADQWSWARFNDEDLRVWRPVPRDRDWALSRLDGPLYGLLRLYLPKYQSFGERYGSIWGLTLSAEPLDRRLLSWLDRAAWDSVVADLAARLDDDVIAGAVDRLPPGFAGAGPGLRRALGRRRADLPRAAARFYAQLAGTVELHGSGREERVEVAREADGAVTVTMATRGVAASARRRRFVPGETREIRIRLGGGDDLLRVTGTGPDRIRLRVVGGDGRDRLDVGSARLLVYDEERPDGTGPGVRLRTRPYAAPPGPPPRDWGRIWSVTPWFEVAPEVGLLLGGGPVLTRYGFRKRPYAARIALRAAPATARGGLNADLSADVRFERPDLRLTVYAAALDLDVVRYFGYGNETVRTGDGSFHHVVQRDLRLEPGLEWQAGRARLGLGAFLRASRADLDRPSLLAAERPYGSGRFRQAGIRVTAGVDTRDRPAYPERGVQVAASLRAAPGVLDVPRAYATARVEAAAYATARDAPASPTLALRAGAERAFGTAPFFEAPAIGGRSSLRGLNSRRFLGDAAAWGGAEVRTVLGPLTVVVPGEWGLFVLGDAGRVWQDGEQSRRWHTAAGGGLWVALLERRSTMSVTAARSGERTRVYVRAGMQF
jgi:hypothetical protein